MKRFANDWGYGGVYMMNCFPYVSTDPKQLINSDAVNEEINNIYLQQVGGNCRDVIFAWGNFNEAVQKGNKLAEIFTNAKALQINKNGSPKHPLYVAANVIPVKFNKQ